MTKLHKSDPIYACWRVAAIHRCVLRYEKSKAWALEKLRELDPSGRRDCMADLWFQNIEDVRAFLQKSDDSYGVVEIFPGSRQLGSEDIVIAA